MSTDDWASHELRVFLGGIAKQLKETESATGKRIRRNCQGGYDLEWIPDPPDELGLNKVTFINVQVKLWRELGSILERIASGEDARRLFGQHLRTNPQKIGEHRLRALAYWSVRARDPEADDSEALELARNIIAASKVLSPTSLRKYAQRHRPRCLALLSIHPAWSLQFEGSEVQISCFGSEIWRLMEYLRKKEGRDKWPKPPGEFECFSDVIFCNTPTCPDAVASIRIPAFPGMSLFARELPPGSLLSIGPRAANLSTISATGTDQE